MSLLSAVSLIKKFGASTILDNISLTVNDGDFVSITGASGSGKSTLLTILGGIDKPTSGEVFIDGIDIVKMKEPELAILRRSVVGFVFQFFNLAPYLTVRENILLPIILAKKSQKLFTEKLTTLCEYLGITAHLNKLPDKLSGGEQQRVAIARGLIFEPKIILMDEPTGNLDSKTGSEIMQLLLRINKDLNTTIIQVTHSEKNANFANRIINIIDGKITETIPKDKSDDEHTA
ncbi:MAG: ABC transporter ATP-binding protein [Christensenellaceae bacterium]|jgi:putative ABC transport system ATP-binding protein|nr:ABC transporter ATP-binding protein [Christensenellaceae bacterium]